MDGTTVNTIVGIVGIVSTIIGTVVGIIGWKSLTTVTKIKNTARADNGASIQQAQVMNIGLDNYAVIRLSKDVTQEELARLIKEIDLVSKTDVESAILEQVLPTQKQISDLEEKVEAMPKIHVSRLEPTELKTGDIWLQVE